jgi:hypothetical protein
MNFKKHTAFMIDFISDFVNGEIERYFFDLDYSAYVIEHFPHMERENAKFADKFANTIDRHMSWELILVCQMKSLG